MRVRHENLGVPRKVPNAAQPTGVLGRVTLLLLCQPLVKGGWCDAGTLAGQEYVACHLRTERLTTSARA